jgi:D-alanyl-D-alanine carboxypeptidase/D-alanyl-D-alanine-endopeptidase (penicillin-binding protein 4)
MPFAFRRFLPGLFLLAVLLASTTAVATGTAEAELAGKIQDLIGQEDADTAFWGVEVYSLDRERTLYSLNAHRYFIPASVTKLFTTAAALDLIGPDYQFRTVVGTRGRIDRGGRLLGNLHFVGAGDPELAGCELPYTPDRKKDEEEEACDPTPVLDSLAAQVAEKGVRTVTGDLVIDQSLFALEPYPAGWSVGDLLWSYGAPVRALSLRDNTVQVTVQPGERPGDPAAVTVDPRTRVYRIDNRVHTSMPGGETILYVRRHPGSRVLTLTGAIALDHHGRKMELAVEAPGEFIAELFRQALAHQGVHVEGQLRVDYASPAPLVRSAAVYLPVVLAEHRSLPLDEAIRLLNKESRNLDAEMLLRMLGQQEPPEARMDERPRHPFEPPPRRADGSTQAGLEVLRAWLANAGVDPREVEVRDGSGLSRRNLVTPRAVVRLLRWVEGRPWAALFRDSLAVAGVDGTLERRMLNSSATGRVRAKTGSLANNSALAGYVHTRAGETLVFALFLNHHTLDNGRAMQLVDRLCEVLAELPPAAAK